MLADARRCSPMLADADISSLGYLWYDMSLRDGGVRYVFKGYAMFLSRNHPWVEGKCRKNVHFAFELQATRRAV